MSKSIGENFHWDDERIIRTWDDVRIVADEYPDEISYAWFPVAFRSCNCSSTISSDYLFLKYARNILSESFSAILPKAPKDGQYKLCDVVTILLLIQRLNIPKCESDRNFFYISFDDANPSDNGLEIVYRYCCHNNNPPSIQ